MRLNGKAAIMRYIGYQETNWRGWQAIKLRYGRVIWIRDHGQHQVRYWTMSEWMNQVDVENGTTVYDTEYTQLVKQYHTDQGLLEIAKRERIRPKEFAAV